MEPLHGGRWIWAELTAFDADAPDYGVASYLERSGFVPDGFTFLMTWLPFVTEHTSGDRLLAPPECSYNAHPYCPERARQQWTADGLRGLIGCLHRAGCLCGFAVFNYWKYPADDGTIVNDPWFEAHPEVMERKDGVPWGTVDMLAPLKEGGTFGDLFIERLPRVMEDYGFDVFQIADGISSPRVPLGKTLYEQPDPAAFLRGKTAAWSAFYRKLVSAVHGIGKRCLFNSAWTRDPFEAIVRYGVDYREVYRAGVDQYMAEDTSPALAILSDRDNGYLMNDAQRRRIPYEFYASLMLSRAAMPDMPVTPLLSVHDTMEQWGVLEHMPAAMARVQIADGALRLFRNGTYRPVTDGYYVCLGDSLTAQDWRLIEGNRETAERSKGMVPGGCAVLWSDAKLDRETDAFLAERRTSTFRLVSELMYAGAQVYTAVRTEDLASYTGDLLVTQPDLLPEKELAAVRAYAAGRVFFLREEICGGMSRLVLEEDGAALAQARCGPYRFEGCEPLDGLWTHPLAYRPMPGDFFAACAAVLPGMRTDHPDCRVIELRSGDEAFLVMMNDAYYYIHPRTAFGQEIRSAEALTKYKGYRVPADGDAVSMRIPPKGCEALLVTLCPRTGND